MEIQRQSDYYSLDRPEVHRANLTSEQIRDMTSGPSIPTGMLNTRTASRDEEEEDALWDSFNYELCPECGQDADKHVMGRDPIIGKPHLYCTAAFGGDAITPAPWLVGDEEEEGDDEEGESAPQVLPPEFGEAALRALMRRHEASPAALLTRLAPMVLSMGGGEDGGGMIEEALGDVSGASSKAAIDRAVAAEGY